jgi:hypothetical protein
MIAAADIGGAYVQSRAFQQQGRLEKQAAKLNAQIEDMRVADALRRGRFTEFAQRRGTRGKIGSQRAIMAAQGIDTGFGSARDIVAETQSMGEMDAQTIMNNAYREAFGYKVAAAEARYRGKMATIAGRGQARSMLITGGMQAAQALADGLDTMYMTGG